MFILHTAIAHEWAPMSTPGISIRQARGMHWCVSMVCSILLKLEQAMIVGFTKGGSQSCLPWRRWLNHHPIELKFGHTWLIYKKIEAELTHHFKTEATRAQMCCSALSCSAMVFSNAPSGIYSAVNESIYGAGGQDLEWGWHAINVGPRSCHMDKQQLLRVTKMLKQWWGSGK